MQTNLRGILSLTLSALLFTAAVLPSDASSRVSVPIGTQIRLAELIALVDESPDGNFGSLLTLKEIIKGDGAQAGRQIQLDLDGRRILWHPTRDAKNFVALFGPGWQTSKHPVMEVYSSDDEIQTLRTLVILYRLPSERERLETLRDIAWNTESKSRATLLQNQLWSDFGQMREPANFPLLLELYPRGDEPQQIAIIRLLDDIGDVRAVPTLLSAIHSPRRSVVGAAVHALRFQFMGAPGVTEAFRQLLAEAPSKSDWRWNTAREYLAHYDLTIRNQLKAESSPTNKADDALKAGDKSLAYREFLTALEEPQQKVFLVRFHRDLIEMALKEHPAEAAQIGASLMPVLTQFVAEDDYLKAAEAATVLSLLQSPEATSLLIRIVEQKTGSLNEKAAFTAAASLIQDPGTGEAGRTALASRPDWSGIRPVVEAWTQPDEVAALTELLTVQSAKKGWTQDDQITRRWTARALGESRDERAGAPLLAALQPYGDNTAVEEALYCVNGPQVDRGIEALMRSEDRGLRLIAMNLQTARLGAALLPLWRKMLDDDSYGDRTQAIIYLGRYGTLDDLKVLRSRADFWSGDRARHYWYNSALHEFQERCNHDWNGQIRTILPSH